MNPLHSLRLAAFVLAGVFAAAPAGAETPFAAGLERAGLSCAVSAQARDALRFILKNPGATPQTVVVPAGLIVAQDGAANRRVVLRGGTAVVPPRGILELSLPAAALSIKDKASAQNFAFTADAEPRLRALLQGVADQPDVPRATAQIAVLCLLEDVTFAQTHSFIGAPENAMPTPAEVTRAIDALGLLRLAAPGVDFALARDPALKALALRNPWCRGKAMAIYGLDLGDGGVAPDLRELLHTQANDNCPVCRQRTLLQRQSEIP